MRELAMRPVDLAPFVEQGQNRINLLEQQAMHRGSARCPVDQLPAGPAGDPAVRPPLGQLQRMTDPAQCPAGVERLVQQVEQVGLGGRVHPTRDPAT